MSLVNDMLRDLDQRRRESEQGGPQVKLTPASEFPVEKNNQHLLFVVIGLLIVAVGLALAWIVIDSSEQTEPLNIRPTVVRAPSISEREVSQALEVPVESVEIAVADPRSSSAAERGGQDNQQAEADSRGAGSSGSAPVDSAVGQIAGRASLEIAEPATARSPGGTDSDALGAGSSTVARATGSALSAASLASRTRAEAQPLSTSVKNVAAMTPEEEDTLAVQQALQMFAENRPADAYAHLEQYILANRYAHQSRETYAKLLMNEGHLLAAYNLADSGLALAPNHAGFKKVKARILISEGRVDQAAELLSSRAPAVGRDLEYHEILASAQLASRDFEGASMSYTSLVQQDRSRGQFWYGFAVSQESLGNRQVAQQAYSRALQQSDLSPNLRRRSQDRLAALSP